MIVIKLGKKEEVDGKDYKMVAMKKIAGVDQVLSTICDGLKV